MKLPSAQQILQHAARTFLRFPLVLTIAVVGTIAAVILTDHEGPPQATILFNILLATILGIPLLTGSTLLAEKQQWDRKIIIGLQMIGLLMLIGYGCTVPPDLSNAPAIYLIRTLLIAVSLHLFVSVAPFFSRGKLNGFWHYNKILFLRGIITATYSIVLYADWPWPSQPWITCSG